jgi:dUTP pyrophosphatase
LKLRDFEHVNKENRKYDKKGILPVRQNKNDAGYDFYTPIDFAVPAGGYQTFFTNVKAYMQDNEWLSLIIRSSLGFKKKLILVNAVGVIDSSYYNNSDNEGNIGCCIYNTSDEDLFFSRGDRIFQGIFQKYLITDSDSTVLRRKGGIGSTN